MNLVVLAGEQIGYSEVWLNPTNDYAHKHLHVAGDRMCEVAYENRNLNDELLNLNKNTEKYKNVKLKIDALNQMARELLLAQSSDWLFIITNGTMVDYAKKRIKDHIGRLTKLYEQIKSNHIDKLFLDDISEKDAIFPDIDYHIYC